MNARDEANWVDLNQAWLTRELRALSERMAARLGMMDAPETAELPPMPPFEPALECCAEALGMSRFERDLLLLLAGIELDIALRRQVHEALGGDLSPDFGFALAALDNGHWDAISPQAPLRRWKLVELEGRAGPVRQGLRIAERVLHFLTGVDARDERLFGLLRPDPDAGETNAALIARVLAALRGDGLRVPLVLLTQARPDPAALRAVAAAAVSAVDCEGLWLNARDLPAQAAELAEIALLLDREALFSRAVSVLEFDDADAAARAATLLAHLRSPAILLGRGELSLGALARHRPVRIDVPAADIDALRDYALGLLTDAGAVAADAESALAPALRQFTLTPAALDAALEPLAAVVRAGELLSCDALCERVWAACREQARGGLDALAQRIPVHAGFDDLVLPEAHRAALRDIARQLRQRERVYRDWGFGTHQSRGLGLMALFAGESGSGKTLAAEAIAHETGLDLYRVDLATLVSKYIGETEKNLKQLFDAAEASGAVLLFDEADALFGKRSEVKDSHDRYANIEVAYLLQRIDEYRGLAILTTNLKSALDAAFLRRLRFVITFPFPDAAARERIWRLQFPAPAPLGAVDFAALAKLHLAGGNIRSVALNAAFRAADAARAIDHAALLEAARSEFAKLERAFPARGALP